MAGKTETENATVPAESEEKQRLLSFVGRDGNTVNTTAMELKDLSLQAITELLGGAVDASEAIPTDQFGPVLDGENKGRLVGVPFVAVHWQFHDGDFGEFVSMWVATQGDERFIVNDGSTGICQQLRALTNETGQNSMLVCRKGLRVSEYEWTDPLNGKKAPAKTYYIDTGL